MIALVFAIAAMPGSMAMPAPASHASHSMTMGSMKDCSAQGQSPCEHMKAHQDQGKPCKNMAICFGLLSCYGMAALPVVQVALLKTAVGGSLPVLHQAVSGVSVPPENPPPIAR